MRMSNLDLGLVANQLVDRMTQCRNRAYDFFCETIAAYSELPATLYDSARPRPWVVHGRQVTTFYASDGLLHEVFRQNPVTEARIFSAFIGSTKSGRRAGRQNVISQV